MTMYHYVMRYQTEDVRWRENDAPIYEYTGKGFETWRDWYDHTSAWCKRQDYQVFEVGHERVWKEAECS